MSGLDLGACVNEAAGNLAADPEGHIKFMARAYLAGIAAAGSAGPTDGLCQHGRRRSARCFGGAAGSQQGGGNRGEQQSFR